MFSKGEVRQSLPGISASGRSTMRGLPFYRMMSSIGVVTATLFGFLFIGLLQGENELIWDRAALVLLALVCYLYSYKPRLRLKSFYRLVNIMFYLYSLQVVVAAVRHGLDFIYLLALFLTLQSLSVAFRSQRQTLAYLFFINASLILGALIWPPAKAETVWFAGGAVMLSSALMFVVVRTKSNYQRNLSIQTELLQSIISKSEEAMFLTDFEGIIYESSEQVRTLFGYSPEELKGQDVSDLRKRRLTEEEDVAGVKKLLTNRFWTDEVEMVRQDGSSFMTYLSISYISQFGQEYLVYRVRDITAERAAREELIQAKDMAERAAKAKSDFLAMMSHEIRTPMNGVIGMTELLERSQLSEQQAPLVKTIRNSGNDLLVIINDILDFAKIERDTITFRRKNFNLHELVGDLMRLLGVQADEKGLSLTASIGPDVPEKLHGDPIRLRQVLINLMGNALKFTKEGGVHLQIRLEKAAEKVQLHFCVEDSGIGVPEEELARLFESFYQVDSSSSRKYGGTGLGLAISQRLVEAMGGSIEAKSTLGKGTSIFFTAVFEHLHSSATEAPRKESDDLSNAALSGELSHLRILVADDNSVNRQVVDFMLQQFGIRPLMAKNGQEVLEIVKNTPVDVVLMDVQMPEMDGIEATKRLLSDKENYPWPPLVVAMTANAMPEDELRCRSAGMQGFLTKPLQIGTLKEALIRCMLIRN